jgi:type IV pilus assembly protein PilY1
MKYNLGWGPSDSNPPGGQGDYFNPLSYDWTINGRIDYVSRLSDGGQVRVPIGPPEYVDSNQQYTDSGGNTVVVPILKMVQLINEDHPQGLTPVTETIKEAQRYFQQVTPAYRSDCDPESNKTDIRHGWCLTEQVPNFEINDVWDPYHDNDYDQKISCAQSHIVYLTDGDPARDAKADEGADKRYDGTGIVNDNVAQSFTGNDNGTLLDDITFALHTKDQRSDISGDQTIKFHAIQCFDTTDAPSLIAGAKAGGFNDINEDGDITNSSEWDANGDGLPDNFYKAEDGYQLEQELLAIFTEISAQGSGGAVATVSQETRAGDLIVRGAFFHKVNANRSKGIWNGHLEVWWPDQGSGLYDFELYGLSFCSDILFGSSKKNCWDAGEFLTTDMVDERVIFTLLETAGVPSGGVKSWNKPEMFEFDLANIATIKPFLELDVDTWSKAGALIQWTRGKVNDDGNPVSSVGTRLDSTVQYRDRKKDLDSGPQWLLGDIIFSTPVVVGAPTLAKVVANSPHVAEYLEYRKANFYRPKMIYVGGNDGMMHAFLLSRWDDVNGEWVQDPNDSRCPDCGKEIWAYIPSTLLPDLKKLAKSTYSTATCQHIAMVDLAPQAFDVYIDHDGDGDREWRTVLLGGLRGGGDAYFAIDVTTPPVDTSGTWAKWDKVTNQNPKVLWEYSVLKNLAVAYEDGTASANIFISRPYADADLYQRIRDLPLSWSEPVVGRMTIPPAVSFNVWHPDYTQTTADTAQQPTWIKESISYANDDTKYRHIAFMGGGFRIFKEPNWDGFTLYPSPDLPETRKGLFKPNLVALDVETGYNLFQETWPLTVKYAPSDVWSTDPQAILWDLHTVAGNTIPYALAHPIAIDAWNQKTNGLGEDGFVDRLYFGDLFGYFYALKFAFDDPSVGTGSLIAKLEMRRTKQVNTTDTLDAAYRTNHYRYLLQPICGKFGSSWSPDNKSIVVTFGTGKLDNIDGTVNDDFNDEWIMSAFNVADRVVEVEPVDSSLLSEVTVDSATYEVTPKPQPTSKTALRTAGSNFTLEIEQLACPANGFSPDPLTAPCTQDASGIRTNCCNWATATGGDCCETGDCETVTPCWDCVYDFSVPGERVIDRPLIAGGLVFFSTALPAKGDPCDVSEGTGNLYVFGYACRPFPDGFVVVRSDGTTTVTPIYNSAGEKIGEQVSFPGKTGVPSRPILDSSGKNVLIQKSNSELVKIPVNLIVKTTQVTGWQER